MDRFRFRKTQINDNNDADDNKLSVSTNEV
jgi:hypothetical protein